MLLTSIILFSSAVAGVSFYKRTLQKSLSTLDNTGKEVKDIQEEAEINHYLAVSSASLVLTTLGALVYPPLTLVSIPLLIYTSSYFINKAYDVIIKERKISAALVDSVGVIGFMATGYYFATAVLYTFHYYSRKLLRKTEDHSRKHLVNILGKQPSFVWIISDGVELEIPLNQLKVGDIIVINAGETIPIDGLIYSGIAHIDQHILTGEFQPIEKGTGDNVFAGTIVLQGQIQVQTQKTGQETAAAQIGKILDNTADFKAKMQSYGERIVDKGALPTLVVSIATLSALGVQSALATLIASFGYQMRVTAPLSMLSFLTIASKNGILIKDGRSLELLNQVDTVVFDKTGTLTEEQPHVGKIHCFGLEENDLLIYAATAEYKQTHPIALAILNEAKQRELDIAPVKQVKYHMGYGIKVKVKANIIRVGSLRFMKMENIFISTKMNSLQEAAHEQGHSVIFIALNEDLVGAIELYPTIRPEAKRIIAQLKQRGLSIYIISGDHEKPTQKLAKKLGIDHYFSETLPEQKADLIKQLQQQEKTVCFVGDGINDAIALKQSQVSISLRGASTIAKDTASIVLMDSCLEQLDHLFNIAAQFNQNMQTNLSLSIVPGFICWGGIFFFHFGILSTILLYDASLLVGVWNAMSPSFEKEKLLEEQGVSKDNDSLLESDSNKLIF